MSIPEERYVDITRLGSSTGGVPAEIRELQRRLDAHIGKGGNAHAIATPEEAGFMSQSDKEKLDTVQNGATQNQTDEYLLSLANATGELPIARVDGLQEEIDRISGDSAAQLREDLASDVAGDLGAHLIAYPSPDGEDWSVADLANPDKGAAMVARGVVAVDSIEALLSLPQAQRSADKKYLVKGAVFEWDGEGFSPESVVPLEAFGAKPGAEHDNGPAFAQMYTFLENFEGTITCGPGRFYTNGTLRIPRKASFKASGKGKTIIDATGSGGAFENNAVLYKGGEAPERMADLGSPADKGDRTISFASPHGLSVGDVFLLYNPTDFSFSGFRLAYRAGEYCTVSDVVSNTEVGLENGLYDSYLPSDIEVYKCSSYCSGTIKGLTAIAPGAGPKGVVRAIAVEFGHKIELGDLGARNSDNSSFSISKCYKLTGRSLDCHQWTQSPGFGTQYGLSVGNSQELRISGSFIGFRHGIAHGGGDEFSIPCRESIVHDFFAKSASGSLAAADWHGNAEYCVYENGTVHGGGLNIAGNNNRISGIKAFGDNLMLILGREILGCDHIVENVECFTRRSDTGRYIINIGGNESPLNENTRFGGQFIFRDILIKAPNNTRGGIQVRNRGFIGDNFDVLVDRFSFLAPNSNYNAQGAVSINTLSGDSPKRVSATNITTLPDAITPNLVLSSDDLSTLVRQDSITGSEKLTTTESSSLASSIVDFQKNFAKSPSITTNLDNHTTGGDRCASIAISVRNTGFTARMYRTDSIDPFTASVEREIRWMASLSEW